MLVVPALPNDTPATMRRIVISVVVVILGSVYLANARAETTAPFSWSTPTLRTVKRVGDVPTKQHSPSYMANLDCQTITYRLVNRQDMLTGCFTPTAFGLFEGSTKTVIFNGTDEALPLKPYSPNQILAPWQNAGNLIALDVRSTGGAYISLYKNPLRHLEDEYNSTGQLTAKKIVAPPEIQIKDSNGQRITVNVPTITISDGGGWLVAETLTGSFVRINLASLEVMSFSSSYGSLGSPGLLMSHVAVSEDGKHVAVYNSQADSLRVYDLSSCTEQCANHNYQPYIHEQINNLRFIRNVRFVNNNLLSFEATTTSTANDGVYLLAPSPNIHALTDYLALGDSYTSGEGAFNYMYGTDTADNRCHLSINSYPLLLTKDLYTQTGGHSVACSGATIKDIANESDSYIGQVRNVANLDGLKRHEQQLLESVESNYLPGYVAQHRFVKRWQPKIVTVSIGGNDIGFGEILKECVVPRIGFIKDGHDCFSSYEDRKEVLNLIDKTIPRWTALYKQLQKQSPMSRIYSIGYPEVADAEGNCALNVHLSRKEIQFSSELVAYLNHAIQQASTDAGVDYVDISKALVGHRLCETASHNVAVNGLTAGTDRHVLGSESYHPNALGHALIEQAILGKTNNLSQKAAASNSNEPNNMLEAPKSGRTIVNKQYQKMTDEIIYRWETPSLRLIGNLLKAFTDYEIRLDGSVIGTAKTDEEGNLTANFPMSGGVSDGLHTVDVNGEDQTGEPISIFQPIYVPRYDYDYDGDDKHNEDDSCLWAINSEIDSDKDGIDDVCDPVIILIPVVPPAGSSQQTSPDQSDTSSTQNPLIPNDQSVMRSSANSVTSYGALIDTVNSGVVIKRSVGYVPTVPSSFTSTNPQSVKGARIVEPIDLRPRTMAPVSNNPIRLAWTIIIYPIIIIWIVVLILLWLYTKLDKARKSAFTQLRST